MQNFGTIKNNKEMKIRIKAKTEDWKMIADYMQYLLDNFLETSIEKMSMQDNLEEMLRVIRKNILNRKDNTTCNIDTTTLLVINSQRSREIMQKYSGVSPYVIGFACSEILSQAGKYAEDYFRIIK